MEVQRFGQRVKAVWVVGVAVLDREHLLTARGEKEIVPADRVFFDDEHRSTPIGVESVSPSDPDRPGVIDRARSTEPLIDLSAPERDEVRDLLPPWVSDADLLARVKQECSSRGGL